MIVDDIKNKKPIRLIYGGEDFGIFEYNETTKRYEGKIGHLTKETLLRAIKDKDYFIQVRSLKNEIQD